MFRTFKTLLKFSTIIILFVSNKVLAFDITQCAQNSYLGIGMLISKMKLDDDYGGNVFAKTNQGIHLSVGKMFTKHFGMEFGFEPTNNKYRQAVVDFPGTALGLPVDLVDRFEFYNTTVMRSKYYLGLVSRLYINDTSFINFLAGAALVRFKLNSTFASTFLTPNYNSCTHFHTNRLLPILKLSFEKIINDKLGIKASIGWVNSSKIQINPKEKRALVLSKLKNTTDFTLGFNYYL